MDEVNPVKILKPENFSFKACLDFLNRGYDECLYQVNKDNVTRLIRISSGLIIVEITDDNENLVITTSKLNLEANERDEIISYVYDWFDLDRDLSGFYKLLESKDQTKGFSQSYHGLRLMGIVDLFEALCWCVIGQQINLTFAHKIKTRLVHKFSDSKTYKGKVYYCFPSPEVLLKASRDDLVAMKFSKQKINYIYNISQAFCDDVINRKELLRLDKANQMEKLLAIKGIGPWTANYVSMKSLRDMTCIAYGDTGLSLSLHNVFDTVRKPDKATIDRIFKKYSGWESYLNFYLWRSLS